MSIFIAFPFLHGNLYHIANIFRVPLYAVYVTICFAVGHILYAALLHPRLLSSRPTLLSRVHD